MLLLLLALSLLPISSPFAFYSPHFNAPSSLLAVTHKLDCHQIRGPITPVSNYIVIQQKDAVSTTTGGIVLPSTAIGKPTEGTVIAVGPGRFHPSTGTLIPNPVPPGCNVLHGQFDGTKINYDSEDCNLIRDDDVILTYTGPYMTLENVTPCKDYVLVDLPPTPNQSTMSGIAVAASVTADLNPCAGIVVKVGEGRRSSDGVITTSPVKVGEEVKFRDYAGQDLQIEGKDYVAVRMVDFLAVLTV